MVGKKKKSTTEQPDEGYENGDVLDVANVNALVVGSTNGPAEGEQAQPDDEDDDEPAPEPEQPELPLEYEQPES